MTEGRPTPTRFIRVVGRVFLALAAIGLLISVAQVVLLSQAAPGLAMDSRALTVAIGLGTSSLIVAVVAVAFSRRRRWARWALAALMVVGIVASLSRLLIPAPAIEPQPPGAPPEYLRLLEFISLADIVVPLAACFAFIWILWRLRSPAVQDQFR